MICPNCNHTNPDGAVQCEACLTPLPTAEACPSCGASVLRDANFCGQCGTRLRDEEGFGAMATFEAMPDNLAAAMGQRPDPVLKGMTLPTMAVEFEATDGLGEGGDRTGALEFEGMDLGDDLGSPGDLEALGGMAALADLGDLGEGEEIEEEALDAGDLGELFAAEVQRPLDSAAIEAAIRNDALAVLADGPALGGTAIAPPEGPTTKIQQPAARLLHLQTDGTIELPPNLLLIHIGKANNRVPPDIDLSGFPHAEVVSRIHADIRCEGGTYYLEDSGSANGTYVNNMPLPVGNRHRLRSGDRISLGKHDLVSFLFQLD
ncbi:MAG: hypothetical protein Fur0042_11170 [Cyanophyceae cyanobacterium]